MPRTLIHDLNRTVPSWASAPLGSRYQATHVKQALRFIKDNGLCRFEKRCQDSIKSMAISLCRDFSQEDLEILATLGEEKAKTLLTLERAALKNIFKKSGEHFELCVAFIFQQKQPELQVKAAENMAALTKAQLEKLKHIPPHLASQILLLELTACVSLLNKDLPTALSYTRVIHLNNAWGLAHTLGVEQTAKALATAATEGWAEAGKCKELATHYLALTPEEQAHLQTLNPDTRKQLLSLPGAHWVTLLQAADKNDILAALNRRSGWEQVRHLGHREVLRCIHLLDEYEDVKAQADRVRALNSRWYGALFLALPTGPSTLEPKLAALQLPEHITWASDFSELSLKLESAKRAIAEVVASRPANGSSYVPGLNRSVEVDQFYRDMREKYADRISAMAAPVTNELTLSEAKEERFEGALSVPTL